MMMHFAKCHFWIICIVRKFTYVKYVLRKRTVKEQIRE